MMIKVFIFRILIACIFINISFKSCVLCETHLFKNVTSYNLFIYSLKWTNDDVNTNFVYEVQLSGFTNSWAAFSFSEDGKMVNLNQKNFKLI